MPDFLVINLFLLALVTMTAIAAVQMRNLLAATMMMSIYSLLMALVWTNMDSMDVAFTEAAVGAGISTLALIGALVQVGTAEKPQKPVHWPAMLVVTATAAALIWGGMDLPRFGDPNAPAQLNQVSTGYIKQDVEKTRDPWGHYAAPRERRTPDYFGGHCPNFVTSVIVSYRGYDTMYETTVIFLAGISMILFLRRRKKPS